MRINIHMLRLMAERQQKSLSAELGWRTRWKMEISLRFLPAVHLAFHYVRSKQTNKKKLFYLVLY